MPKNKTAKQTRKLPTGLSYERKVFMGFWTWPENKDAIQQLAREKRQSASSYVDALVETHVIAKRRGLRR